MSRCENCPDDDLEDDRLNALRSLFKSYIAASFDHRQANPRSWHDKPTPWQTLSRGSGPPFGTNLRVDVEQAHAKLLAGVNFEQCHAELMAALDGIAAGKGHYDLVEVPGHGSDCRRRCIVGSRYTFVRRPCRPPFDRTCRGWFLGQAESCMSMDAATRKESDNCLTRIVW
jgi:hypothetical protein